MRHIHFNDFRNFTRDRFIDAQTSTNAKLAPTVLLTNEMGVEGDITEVLSTQHQARVIFTIPAAKIKSAELLFYVNADRTTAEKPMTLQVNGHRLTHRQKRAAMLTGGWDRKRIDARYLQPGTNEFIFSNNGVLHIDPGPCKNSSRSFDGGQVWHNGTLGSNGDIEGEYLVRLRLKGHPPQGLLTSPYIDLADLDGSDRIVPPINFGSVKLTANHKTPTGTHIHFEMRSGSTPSFTPQHWTPWQSTTKLAKPDRFIQWRVYLHTKHANQTPVLERVTVQTSHREKTSALKNLSAFSVDHPALVYSSYPFTYLTPHPRVTRLVKQYRLEEVISTGSTELAQLALLRDWIHSQWLGWQSDKYPYTPPWDPLEILEVTKGNWGYGMCTHYGAVFAGCAAALGWVSRVVVVDHHCLAEVWCESLQKWILEDAGPQRGYDATYEINGVPLNALELHDAINSGKLKQVKANKLPQNKAEPMTDYTTVFCRFGIPPRNNHLIFAEPAELRHGAGQYHWDGYLWWSDNINPKYSEYSLQTSRPEDFYWSVNQTRLYVEAGDTPTTLKVQSTTTTPNFSHFLIQTDAGDWQELAQMPLIWTLHAGHNSLAVRSVNVFGKVGRIAQAQVTLNI